MRTILRGAALSPALAGAILLCPGSVLGQSTDEMNAANNPLQPTLGVNFQDYYVADVYDADGADSNSLLLRGVAPHKIFGHPQLLRATLPMVTSPDLPPTGDHTDIGDLNLFDIFLFKAGSAQVGVGPQVTFPTAGRDETGTGKWQAGVAVLGIVPKHWGLVGGLVTWQASFAGDDDRRRQDNLIVQPLIIYNFPNGWYARSTPNWTWDLEQDTCYIPIGIGGGKVWKGKQTTYNVFVEPQPIVAHDGQVPMFQVFFGLNLQFPL